MVPQAIIEATLSFLQERGRLDCEGFVIWSGVIVAKGFEFRSAVIPSQEAIATDEGLLVFVDGQDLFEVNKRLYQRGEIAGAQIHSHPTVAYHSDTDDHFPLVT